jgi:RsiW-degrading membrane proteinase PrsW (M82 family)
MINETNVLIFAFLGGIVPALFWLWFWIREDRLNPEPKSALLSAFIGGILAMLLALFFELIIYYLLVDASTQINSQSPAIFWVPLQNFANKYNLINIQTHFWGQIQDLFNNFSIFSTYNIDIKRGFLVVIIAPIIEELFKLLLTYNICLRRKINDEPIDASIYMLTAALGFAAVETALFLVGPLAHGNILDGLIAGNFRSIGPMLIHLVSSAMLGLFIGLTFYKSRVKKFLYLIMGFVIAVILHSIFNFFIMLNDTTHNITFFWIACLGTWIFVVVLLIFFEKVKKVVKPINEPALVNTRGRLGKHNVAMV